MLTRLRLMAKAAICPGLWRLRPRQMLGLMRASITTRPACAPSASLVYVNCPPVGTEGFRRYLQGWRRMSRGERVPLAAHVAVTDRCPHTCARCSNLRRADADPPTQRILDVLRQLKDAGTASVAFTGGEPMLRDDLEDLVAASNPHMPPILFTSGVGLDERRAKTLRQAGLSAAFVSLDHWDAPEHDRIRGRSGAFADAVSAIQACVSAGIYTAAQAVVSPELLRDGTIGRYLAFCSRLGVHDVVLLEPVSVGGDGVDEALSDQQQQMLADLHRRSAADRSMPKVTAMSYMESAEFYGCQAGVGLVYVATSGEVFPCDFAPISFGNVHEVGLGRILERMREVIGHASCTCMAGCVAGRGRSTLPAGWDDENVRYRIAEQQAGLVPALMRWMMRHS